MQKKVSLLTPTSNNRFVFFKRLIMCVEIQDYKNIEWIILDDYFNESLYKILKSKSYVKYYALNEKKNIGEKRNKLNQLATGDILINIDDDDYYPPNKVSYTVHEMTNSDKLISGCSCIYMYHDKIIYKIGPYADNHATANTFAYYKSYDVRYGEVNKGEEKSFLRNFTTSVLQLESEKVILVIRHKTNTANNQNINRYKNVKKTTLTLDYFIKDPYLRSLFE